MVKFQSTQSNMMFACEMLCTRGNSSSDGEVGNTCTATEAGSTDVENYHGQRGPKISVIRGNL